MQEDNMHQFLSVLIRWGMKVTVALAALIIIVGVALFCWPELIAKLLCLSLAGICVSAGGYILICLLFAFFRK